LAGLFYLASAGPGNPSHHNSDIVHSASCKYLKKLDKFFDKYLIYDIL